MKKTKGSTWTVASVSNRKSTLEAAHISPRDAQSVTIEFTRSQAVTLVGHLLLLLLSTVRVCGAISIVCRPKESTKRAWLLAGIDGVSRNGEEDPSRG